MCQAAGSLNTSNKKDCTKLLISNSNPSMSMLLLLCAFLIVVVSSPKVLESHDQLYLS